jgi:hypothetical protein
VRTQRRTPPWASWASRKRPLIISEGAPEECAGGADATRCDSRGSYRGCNTPCCHGEPRCSQACDGRRQTGAEDASLSKIGIADNRFAHRRRILSDAVQIARSAARCVREHTKIGAINVVTLQIRNGGLELFRIVKNGDSFADCGYAHAAVSPRVS